MAYLTYWKKNFRIRKMSVCIALVAIMTGIPSCGVEDYHTQEDAKRNIFLMEGADFLDESKVTYYYYDRLPICEKEAYSCIYNALTARHAKVAMPDNLEETDLARLFRYVYYDHPDVFWYDDTYFEMYEDRVYFVCEAKMSDAEIEEKTKMCQDYLSVVKKKVPEEASEYEISLGLYEYIINDLSYDHQNADQTMVSAVERHMAVCAGYSRLYQYLMQNYGIECTIITGLTDKGEAHMWNTSYLDGSYYYTDITTGEANSNSNEICYDFLNVSKREIEMVSNFEKGQILPTCTDTSCNYYVKNGMNYTSYNRARLKRQFDQGFPVIIRCANQSVYTTMITHLIDNREIFEFTDNRSTRFETNDQIRRIKFYIE